MYTILELQTSNGQTDANVEYRQSKDEALSEYYKILAQAAVSTVQYHAAVVMDERGQYLARECYTHIN